MTDLDRDACIDQPRVTDYKFGEMVGVVGAIPAKVEHKRTAVQDQSIERNPSTKYACTCFEGSHCVNEMNAIEESGIETKGEDIWWIALGKDADVNAGWYLQKAVDLLRELKYISGYSVVETPEEAKRALSIGQMIYTWTNRCDWAKTAATNVFAPGSSYGHAFCLIGYDDALWVFIAKNSYGPDRYDGWYFFVPYEHYDKLFTKYALVDMKDVDLVAKHKAYMDEKMIAKTIENGLMNGQNMGMNMTRRELAIVIGRLLTLIESKK